MKKKLIIITFCLLFLYSIGWAADDNTIKYWIGNHEIIVEKEKGLFGISEKKVNIDISNILNLKTISKETSYNSGWSITTLKVDFDYKYNIKIVPCTAAITYSWLTAKGPLSDEKLETLIVNSLGI